MVSLDEIYKKVEKFFLELKNEGYDYTGVAAIVNVNDKYWLFNPRIPLHKKVEIQYGGIGCVFVEKETGNIYFPNVDDPIWDDVDKLGLRRWEKQ